MVMRVPTLLEQEKLDEEKLLKDIDHINQNFKEGNKKMLLDAVSKLLTDGSRKSHSLGSVDACVALSGYSDVSTAFGSNESYPENIIAQNLQLEEVLKIIVIGDKGVGKSIFIDKVCGINASLTYTPTLS
jgi:hypothetical protein